MLGVWLLGILAKEKVRLVVDSPINMSLNSLLK